MSRWIDADNLHNAEFQDISGYGENVAYRVGWNDAIDAICENEPTIDIVRCKECKHYDKFPTWSACTYWSGDPYEQASVNDDDFCSYGEREGE